MSKLTHSLRKTEYLLYLVYYYHWAEDISISISFLSFYSMEQDTIALASFQGRATQEKNML